MHIAITADPYIPVPPLTYGGIERVIDLLVRGLTARGHVVTLVAHPASTVATATLVGYGCAPHAGIRPRVTELVQVGSALWSRRHDIDVVHSFGRLAALLPVLPDRLLPKVQSYQRDRIPWRGVRRASAVAGPSLTFTACSSWMYASRPATTRGAAWHTVYNGVDLAAYDFRPRVPDDAPLMFLGRLEPIKGPHVAIDIARAAGRRLVIAGNIVDTSEGRAFFDTAIAPSIDGASVQYVGAVDDRQKNMLLGSAAALLMPISWDEPFGIVMVEAMACGTPVIGFRRGSVPEVVDHGVSGFICDDAAAAVAAVKTLSGFDRAAVRQRCARRFGADVIVSAYESLYEASLARVRTPAAAYGG